MNVLGRIFLKSRKDSRKDVKTERRKDGVFLRDVEELTFLIIREGGPKKQPSTSVFESYGCN